MDEEARTNSGSSYGLNKIATEYLLRAKNDGFASGPPIAHLVDGQKISFTDIVRVGGIFQFRREKRWYDNSSSEELTAVPIEKIVSFSVTLRST